LSLQSRTVSMGPEKVSRTINKIKIKRYENQNQHEDVPSSTKSFLSLPKHEATPMGFIALVTGHQNVLSIVMKMSTPGVLIVLLLLSSVILHISFTTLELARNSQSHSVGNRTPRIPVIVPTDRNATDDDTPVLKNAISSTKRNNDKSSNDHANFSINECSHDGRSRIMEATKGVECQAFLETRGTGDTEICHTRQPLKKRMDQTMDRGWTSKVGHETMMAVKEGNKSFGLLEAQQMCSVFISADDMLILDMLQSLVNTPDKMSKLKINIPSGILRKSNFTSESKDEGHSPIYLSKQGKPVDEFSASKTKQKKCTKLLDAVLNFFIVPAEEINVAHAIDITEGSSNFEPSREKGDLAESTANISCEVYPNVPTEINPEIKYLNHPYLRHISRLAGCEWSIIRSYRGKPRRFSDNFLVVERKQLEDYRQEVRTYYGQLSDGSLDSLPADVAWPFSIGQQITARHPSSRELCDGKVVMVEQDCCKVQFDNPELGVDLVKDIDFMPVNWLDNLPDNVRCTLDSHGVHSILEMEHVSKLTQSGTRDHTINEVSIPELLNSLDITSDEQLEAEYSIDSERTQKESTSDGTRLADSRHPPANIAGILESFSAMLRPSCSENLAKYRDRETYLDHNEPDSGTCAQNIVT
ncbi:Protein ALWAYS EARLY 2, partial [Dichanthelium oligosanthes]